ncbi:MULTISPECIES: Fe2+-dependent dioxygenase [unclassified Prochlorococcus]|uniref:Fe2+-dependent dioxygenase n=1 Tax=unclassified Prochlorococcus TaxID=2627481 RepID=UPI0005339972|nr:MULTISPECIES: Fe2+-dependent dioxygenase [unclassified Prochlorococcus]KGG14963.1 Iron-uptake factor PiuC [Prochlorococcus sp. MIT 0602]KGG15601.1 Iron-uptake factor PiuC [Prochlorococcus sp. MIT 0603]
MDFLVHKLIGKAEAAKCLESIESDQMSWESGKRTAGTHAAELKDNLQLNRNSKIAIENVEIIRKAITSDQLIKSFSLPRKIHGVMFTKTSENQGYGIHIDNPYMSSGRSDLSFTLFLNDPEEYEGGELSIHTLQEVKKFKLAQGHLVIYPSTSLHSVEQVKSGQRVVCVGWIQSYVSNNDDRTLLFGLDAGAKGLLAKHGRSAELDLVFQSYSNLLRRLGD